MVSVAPPGLCFLLTPYQGLRCAFGLLHPWLPSDAAPRLKPKSKRPEPLLALVFWLLLSGLLSTAHCPLPTAHFTRYSNLLRKSAGVIFTTVASRSRRAGSS